jgi:hypothetical protein
VGMINEVIYSVHQAKHCSLKPRLTKIILLPKKHEKLHLFHLYLLYAVKYAVIKCSN